MFSSQVHVRVLTKLVGKIYDKPIEILRGGNLNAAITCKSEPLAQNLGIRITAHRAVPITISIFGGEFIIWMNFVARS